MKKRKTKTGDKGRVPVRARRHFAGIAAIGLALASLGQPAQKRTRQEGYGLIAGTVFQTSGFSVRGAEVSLTPDPETRKTLKVKEQRITSDGRGEFAFRVPAAPGKYTVKAKASGFAEQAKPAAISGDERVDVVFQLEPKK